MEDVLVQCVERYRTLSGVRRLRGVISPFLDEQSASRDVRAPSSPSGESQSKGAGQAGAVLEDSTKSAGKKNTKAKEPTDGEPRENNAHPYAARVLMKLLYAARMARFDLLKPINDLAATSWTGTLPVTDDFTGSCAMCRAR